MKEFDDFFFGSGKTEVGAGTGFIWDDQGHIVTNYHVVQDQRSQFMISFHNNKTQLQATIVGVEPKLDIAVLKVEKLPAGLKPITAGTSQDLKVDKLRLPLEIPLALITP
jgi:S1-C subfamily serine protease